MIGMHHPGFALIAALAIAWLLGAYLRAEARYRWRWSKLQRGERPRLAGADVYRTPGLEPVFDARAPLDVRRAGLVAMLVGQLLIASIYLFAHVVAAARGSDDGARVTLTLWIPSLWVALPLVRDGLALVRRERPRETGQAKGASWLLFLYGTLLAGLLLLFLLVAPPGTSCGTLLRIAALLAGWPAVAVVARRYLDRVTDTNHPDLL
jgi:hypothetical protein